jgi:magnesium transporter
VIRALSVGKLQPSDASKVLRRELVMGASLGLILAPIGAVSCIAFESTRNLGMVLTMCFAVIAVVTVGALLGSGVPLLLEKLGIDPAVSSTPFIASLVDIAGLVIYFEIGKVFLG